jgi:hypothetical protein
VKVSTVGKFFSQNCLNSYVCIIYGAKNVENSVKKWNF